ncbi:hypothetical protein KJ781_04435 [Patescibacteria group bacterium]|nr:hypothetical protein [Patescibacteria group bacterium]MBU1449069.1 hypothetical protein [Patescibacteria group bacterium]
MANNRMQIYCKKCLEVLNFAKYYPVAWGVHNDVGESFNEFFEKHDTNCWKEESEGSDLSWGEGMYGLREENDDDGYFCDYRERPYKIYLKK